ncbi:MAG: HPr family phosphocarrier protein [Bacteroidota bacterium]
MSSTIRRKVTVENREGLHARPSSVLVRDASRYPSDFFIEYQGYRVNGKSILGVMTLAAEHGAELILITEGEKAAEAMEHLISLFENRFGMEENEGTS